jgi:hypothetical protein
MIFMIPDEHAKSYLSKSYINAVATQAGYGCQFTEPDYGIDATISEIQMFTNRKFIPSGYDYKIQIKSSHNYRIEPLEIVYSIKQDTYDRMTKCIGGYLLLVLFCIPERKEERVIISEDCMQLRNCCYWYRVTNKDKLTLHIPRSQIFDAAACQLNMEITIRREW